MSGCGLAASPSLPVGVAMGNSALKPIKGRGNEGSLNLGRSWRVHTINYVILSNMQYQNSGKVCAPARIMAVPSICFSHKVLVVSFVWLAAYSLMSVFIQGRKKW